MMSSPKNKLKNMQLQCFNNEKKKKITFCLPFKKSLNNCRYLSNFKKVYCLSL